MTKFTDQKHLVTQQYKDDKNLQARMELHQRYSTNPIGWHTWVFDHLQISQNSQILEIGSGNGMLWAINQARIQPSWNIILGDLSHGMLVEAKKLLSGHEARFEFQVLDVQLLKYEGNRFDTVIANHMLYHVPNIQRALLEIYRVLKPKGRLYAATNGQAHMMELAEIAQLLIDHDQELSTDFKINNMIYNFRIENGRELLGKYFSDIRLHLYPDALHITEPAPIVDYLLSLTESGVAGVKNHKYLDYCQVVAEELKRRGGLIKITKSTGLFEALKS